MTGGLDCIAAAIPMNKVRRELTCRQPTLKCCGPQIGCFQFAQVEPFKLRWSIAMQPTAMNHILRR